MTVPEPTVTTTVADLAYLENGTTAADAVLTVADADSAYLTAATVTMTTNYLNGQDTLAFTTQNGITGTWTAGTGVLALSGLRPSPSTRPRFAPSPTTTTAITPTRRPAQSPFGQRRHQRKQHREPEHRRHRGQRRAERSPTGARPRRGHHRGVSQDLGLSERDRPRRTTGRTRWPSVKITTLPRPGHAEAERRRRHRRPVRSAPATSPPGCSPTRRPLNANGSRPTPSFTFQVQDNGGTANGGVDLDASPNTITFNVTAVNDAPVDTVPAPSRPTRTRRRCSRPATST